jgi:hypothetical protein
MMPSPSALPSALLDRARLHAGLAGFDDDEAARLVHSAQREAGQAGQAGQAGDPTRFWRALYRSIASTSRSVQATDPITAALASLPVEARTSFLLRVAEAMSPRDIAAALDEPEARARRHLASGITALREALASGRPDAEWIAEVHRWIASPPAMAAAPPTPTKSPGQPATGERLRPRPRQTTGWRFGLPLALGLAALALPVLWLTGSLGGRGPIDTPEPTASPLETILALPDEDFALVADDVDLDTLARLDFLIWDAQADAP